MISHLLTSEFLKTLDGRVRRKDYFFGHIFMGLIGFLLGMGLPMLLGDIGYILLVPVFLFMVYFGVLLVVKRLHDVDFEGYWYFINFVPFLNIAFALYVLFKDGTPGPNRFGPSPKEVFAPPQSYTPAP